MQWARELTTNSERPAIGNWQLALVYPKLTLSFQSAGCGHFAPPIGWFATNKCTCYSSQQLFPILNYLRFPAPCSENLLLLFCVFASPVERPSRKLPSS